MKHRVILFATAALALACTRQPDPAIARAAAQKATQHAGEGAPRSSASPPASSR